MTLLGTLLSDIIMVIVDPRIVEFDRKGVRYGAEQSTSCRRKQN